MFLKVRWANAEAEPVDQYLKSFHWNKVKYRADKPIGELIDMLQKVRHAIDPGP